MENETRCPLHVGRFTRFAHLWGLLAIAMATGSGFRADSKSIPSTTLNVAGLARPAEILIDRWGVPHIYAKTERDAFFVQGFNAARDRLFQIDLWRRRGLGQLAEVFGPAYVEQDKAARLFLFRGDLDKEWRRYSSKGTNEAAGTVTAFVQGINAYVEWLGSHSERVPFEFKHLGYLPAKWAPEDVVRIRSHGLHRNLQSEVDRANVACKASLKADEIRVPLQPPWETQVPAGLDPCLPKDVLKVFLLATQSVVVTKESLMTSDAEATRVAALDRTDEALEGSNNWVVSPKRSATGRAIMANDPHRAYSAPSLRYITHLSAPGLNVIGAGEPALPGISIGHNGTIAFGITIFPIDQHDLYVYELNPAQASEYRYQSGWEPFKVIREQIRVKNGQPVTADLLFTRHGPVIFVEKDERKPGGRAFAVRSVWLDPGTSSYFNAIDSMRAQTLEQFRHSMQKWGAPPLNHVYADVKGNIAWLPRGLTPKRPNWDGLLPVPGDGRYEWAGFWNGEELPSVHNPPQGWFATANSMNLPPDYPYRERKPGFEWANEARFTRISEVLSGLPKISLEQVQDLQNDILSIPARRLVTLLAGLTSTDVKTQAALDLLRSWDFRELAESAPTALFEVWQSRHLRKAFAEAVLPKPASEVLPGTDMRVLLSALENPTVPFGASAVQRRNDLLLTTLKAAFVEMEKLQGSNPKVWQWGKLHHNFNEHAFARIVDESMRAKLDVGPIAKHGSEFTPNQSAYRVTDFRQTGGPSFRIVVDVGNWDNSRAMNHPGQSGDAENSHYRDLAPLWRRGEYFPLRYSRKAVEQETEQVIHLVPANKAQ
jgi:penicillin amidase